MYCCIGSCKSVFNDVSQYVLGKAILQTFQKKKREGKKTNKTKKTYARKWFFVVILCQSFFQESYNGNRERSLEDKSPRHPYDGLAKKARSSFESQPQVFSGPAGGGDPYGLFLYQTMQAAAAMAGGGKGQVHPAALAALSNYQAIKV